MDTSETYIKMSERAEKIQQEHGEVWIAFGSGILHSYDNVYYKCLTKEANCRWHLIWLPRQDQLQEMAWKGSLLNLNIEFIKFLELERAPSYAANFTSMEQLWLAFVQKELHQKVWSGKEWIKV